MSIDFTDVGKSGLMIQYEDIVSATGYNLITYMKSKGYKNDKLESMSNKDILLSYINRQQYDPSIWLKNEFNVDCSIEEYSDSEVIHKPNMLYAYKMFTEASKNKISDLIIYSKYHSKAIEKHLKTFQLPDIKYEYGDILPILKNHPNVTFTTSSPDTIRECCKSDVPFELVIVDDFMYVSDILTDNTFEDIKKNKPSIYLMFTSIISAGVII